MRAPICLISRTAKELLAFIRNMMEWLGGTISKEDLGESNKNQRRRRADEDEEVMGALALRFKFIEIFSTPDQLINKFSSREPKLILAVPASLSHGSSRSLFSEFAGVEGNVVVLTERTQQGTLNRYLMDRWEAAQEETEKWQDGKIGEPVSIDRPIDIELRSKIPLQGEELEQFRENQKLEREQAAARKAVAARQQQIRDEESMTNEVYTPKVGEMVRIGENIENFTVALSDALMSSIKMSQYEDNEIAFVKGKLTNPTSTGIYVLDPVKATIKQTEDVEMANGEDYTTVSTKNTIAQSLPRAFMIGDLKLTYLKVTLNRQGISAEFAGEGILVCRSTLDGEEDTVAVRKTRKGEVRVEGDASNLFYTVREEIYKLHALVETE
ncbi:hypothetical protein FRC18_002777 [Serendipita sp. 400]|nr:hypothetical protein FRC18_002777 [Serendipita sp. 400]